MMRFVPTSGPPALISTRCPGDPHQIKRHRESCAYYQISSPPASRNFPLGPCCRSATHTISASPSPPLCWPLYAFRSVAVKPGLTEFTGGRATALHADSADAKALDGAVDRAAEGLGGLDILATN